GAPPPGPGPRPALLSTARRGASRSYAPPRCRPSSSASRRRARSRLDPEPLQKLLVGAPAGLPLCLEREKNRGPEKMLDFWPRAHADLLHDRTAFADHNLLLRLRFDVELRAHDLLAQLLDLDRDCVRNLLAREGERLLANELRHLVLGREVAALIGRKVRRPLGQELDELLAQSVDSVTGLRAHRVQRMEVAKLRRSVHLGGDVTRLQRVA